MAGLEALPVTWERFKILLKTPLFVLPVLGGLAGCVLLFMVMREAWTLGGAILIGAWAGVAAGLATCGLAYYLYLRGKR